MKKIILFDVDGTLTNCGCQIDNDMIDAIKELYEKKYIMGIVGGGTYEKITWQLGQAINYFEYIFAECGSVIYKRNGVNNFSLIFEKNMLDYCNRDLLNLLIKKSLNTISNMPILYSGHNIDFRKGLVYVSPPGMQSTSYERSFFMDTDKKFFLRSNLINELRDIDSNKEFEIVCGGLVGIAIYPNGWDKSQVINYIIDNTDYKIFYYFGDKTEIGGNDYPIYIRPDVIGICVKNYIDTIAYLKYLFK